MKELLFEEEKEYVAMVEASKCRTYIGFIEALNEAFFINFLRSYLAYLLLLILTKLPF